LVALPLPKPKQKTMLTRKINLPSLVTQFRAIATTKCCDQVSNKQVNVLKKIMAGREKGKKRWVYDLNLPKMENPNKISSTMRQGKQSNRRVTVLNKLFMKNVTDLMATDTFAASLYGYGLQVSKCCF
jgi:Tfp pilus assembly protein PilW